MNYLDIIIAIIILIFSLKGLQKGLIMEVAGLAALIGGLYGAIYLSDITAMYLVKYINVPQEYLSILSLVITFLLLVFIIRLLGNTLSTLLENISLGGIDKIGGFLFGTIKGALLASVIILVLNTLNISQFINSEKKQQSILYQPIENIAPYLYQNSELVKNTIEFGKESLEKGQEKINNEIDETPSPVII